MVVFKLHLVHLVFVSFFGCIASEKGNEYQKVVFRLRSCLEANLQIRIDFPFTAQFEFIDPGNNSRELRSQALQIYLQNSGMELGYAVEEFQVTSFNGDDNGEFWTVKVGK